MPSSQSTDKVLMVRPAAFRTNTETAGDNVFQQIIPPAGVPEAAVREFDQAADVLRQRGVRVFIADPPPAPETPDRLFPNNWISFHEEGFVVLYPMMAPNRRQERRKEVLDQLKEEGLSWSARIDLSPYEDEGRFLEGTGSLVPDRLNRVVYACLSGRTCAGLVQEWCAHTGYTPVLFHAHAGGKAVYHTNVVMSVGTRWAVVADGCIGHPGERAQVMEALAASGRVVIPITEHQVFSFCGNILEVKNEAGHSLIVVSDTAWKAFTSGQKEALCSFGEPVVVTIPVIEQVGGGGVRCMLAELFAPAPAENAANGRPHGRSV